MRRRALEVVGLVRGVVVQARLPLAGRRAAQMGGHQGDSLEQLDHPLADVGVQRLADVAVRHRVIAAGDGDVAVGVDLDRPDLAQAEGFGRQRPECGLLMVVE